MSISPADSARHDTELVYLYALRALPREEMPAAEAHIAACADCRRELEALRPVVESLVASPIDPSRPSASLWGRLAQRIAADSGEAPLPPEPASWTEPQWTEVAPGIACKLLSEDRDGGRVSMLVRLAPGVAYPPHRHAGVEELHLLDGELWIGERKLAPGDYNRAEPGSIDRRVFSETGCTCVLVTSARDSLI